VCSRFSFLSILCDGGSSRDVHRVVVLVRNVLIATATAWRDLACRQATPHSPRRLDASRLHPAPHVIGVQTADEPHRRLKIINYSAY
jgi:hypothetical protein